MTKQGEAILEQIRSLPESEQQEIADALAVRLSQDGELPEWQKQLLAERIAEHERNPDDVIPAEEVFKELGLRWRQ